MVDHGNARERRSGTGDLEGVRGWWALREGALLTSHLACVSVLARRTVSDPTFYGYYSAGSVQL